MTKQLTLHLSGKVQGVFFRDNTKKIAQSLNLTGYVKNLDDGRVKIVAQGSNEDLDKLISWAKEGPSSANVTSISKNFSEPEEKHSQFKIKR